MNRLCALLLSAALAGFGSVAVAQTSPTDQILLILQGKGYAIVTQERTWLGRGRVVAEKDGTRREVVFNPGTGEILRDYAVSTRSDDDRGADDQTTSTVGDKKADQPTVGTAGTGDMLNLEDSLDGIAPGTGVVLE